MSNVLIGESSDMYDPVTGRWLGVIDRNGRENFVPSYVDDGNGNIQSFPIKGNVGITGGTIGGASVKSIGQYRRNAPSMTKWTAARARASTNLARSMWLGHSHLAGTGAGTGTNGFVGAAKLGISGRFAALAGHNYGGQWGDNNVSNFSGVVTTWDTRYTLGTGWAPASTVYGFGGQYIASLTPDGAGALAFAIDTPSDTIQIYFARFMSYSTSVAVRIDGVLVDTFNARSDGIVVSDEANSQLAYKSYAVAAGMHTVSITPAAAASNGAYYHGGVIAFNSADATKTPIHLQGGYAGSKMTDLAFTGFGARPLRASVGLVPDFVHLQCETNDISAATTVSAWRADLETVVSNLSATATGCILVGFPQSNAGVTNGLMESYVDASASVATDYGWGVFDLRSVMGGSYVRATALGYVYDTAHPNATGYTAEAAAYLAWLVENGWT